MSQSDEQGFHRSSIEMLTIRAQNFHETKQTKFRNKNAYRYRSPLSLHHQLMLYEYPKCLDYFNQPQQPQIPSNAQPNFSSLIENDGQTAVLLSEFFPKRLNCVFNRFGENLMLKRDIAILIRNINNRIRNDQIITFHQRSSSPPSSAALRFNSNFQGGNLHCVFRDRQAGTYYLLLQNDINTHGYNVWFHFNVQAYQAGTYQFVIANFTKEIKFADEILLLTYSSKNNQYSRQIPLRCEETKFRHCESAKRFWCIKFSYSFEAGEDLYISLSPPYSFSKLLRLLKQVTQPFYQSISLAVEIAGKSELGNFIPCLKVAAKERPSRQSIIITARQHPCESMGSFVCQQIIKILTKNTPLAHQLTEAFTFYIIPMVNPDGVIHGNSRTNLIGYDINRTWDLGLHTQTVEAVQIWEHIRKVIDQGNQIAWSFDLHGHSKELGYFCYFCQQNQDTLMLQYFLSEHNIYRPQHCGFTLNKSKRESIRGQFFCKLNVVNAVTVQTSYYGYKDEHGKLVQYNQSHYIQIANKLLQSLSQIVKINKNKPLKEELLHTISRSSHLEKKSFRYHSRQIDSDSDPQEDYLRNDERKQIREQNLIKTNTQFRTRTQYYSRGRSSLEGAIYKNKKDGAVKNIRYGASSFHKNATIEKDQQKSLTFYAGRRTLQPSLKRSQQRPKLRRKIDIHCRKNSEISPVNDGWQDQVYFKKSFELRMLREQEQNKRMKTYVGGFRTCYQVLGLKTIVYPTATNAGIDFQNSLKSKKDIVREIRGKQLHKGIHKRKLSEAYGNEIKKKF